ncbi:rhamnulokinase [Planctomycetales bacterium ZRK34]|nr:rhamnulokinase [Planctomycetales bacterium ZRK34]
MTKPAYLAIDLGAESGRAMLGVIDDGKLSLHEMHRFLHLPRRLPSGLHWDLTGLWGNIIEGIRAAAAWADDNDVTIRSIGVDTWGVDHGYIGRSGELLALPHAYRDERNLAAYDKVIGELGEKYVYDQTGIQFMPLNSLYQVVAQHDAEPCVLENAAHLLFMPDLLHYFLSGKPIVESSIASTSQMLDPRTGSWNTELLGKLGLPTQMLGLIVPPGTKIGPILPHIVSETGASADIQVIAPAGHDTASAIAAVPAEPGTDWAYLSSGTWSLMGAELDEPCLIDAAREAPFTHETGVDGKFRFLKNIAGLWLVQEVRRDYEKQGITYDYNKLTELAAAAEPLRTLLNTDHGPFAAPGDMPAKMIEFAKSTGQPEPTEVGQQVRAALESLALTYRLTMDKLETVLNRKFDVLHIVGGGGKNRLLNQMTADAMGRTVIVGPYEATAAGNILIQAMGAGDVDDLAHIRAIIRDSFEPVTYHPQATGPWDEAYERFKGLLKN